MSAPRPDGLGPSDGKGLSFVPTEVGGPLVIGGLPPARNPVHGCRFIYEGEPTIPAGLTIREWQGLRAPRRRTLWQRFKRWLHGR